LKTYIIWEISHTEEKTNDIINKNTDLYGSEVWEKKFSLKSVDRPIQPKLFKNH